MNPIPGFPTTAGLHTLVDRFAGAQAYIVPMTGVSGKLLGNNGDTLMHRVFDKLLDELEITRTTDQDAADILIVPPSGALLEAYAFPALLADRIRDHGAKPLVIFPSSAYFPASDPSWIFQGRSAETLLILREARSMTHLQEQWGEPLASAGVELALDHDVVASGHAYVPGIIDMPSRNRHVLIAARRDRESSAAGLSPTVRDAPAVRLRDTIVSAIPYGRFKTAITRRARAGVNNAVAQALIDSLPDEIVEEIGRASEPQVKVDVSANQFATFAEYRRSVADASTVVTNRLHVALPSAILGKRVVLVEAGYYKLRGVYERSLSELPHVTLIEPTLVGT